MGKTGRRGLEALRGAGLLVVVGDAKYGKGTPFLNSSMGVASVFNKVNTKVRSWDLYGA
jgi:hypothetical protein